MKGLRGNMLITIQWYTFCKWGLFKWGQNAINLMQLNFLVNLKRLVRSVLCGLEPSKMFYPADYFGVLGRPRAALRIFCIWLQSKRCSDNN